MVCIFLKKRIKCNKKGEGAKTTENFLDFLIQYILIIRASQTLMSIYTYGREIYSSSVGQEWILGFCTSNRHPDGTSTADPYTIASLEDLSLQYSSW